MNDASVLPMKGIACCNSRMHSGKVLGAALAEAMRLKAGSGERLTQQAVATAFGVAQSSVAEWIKYGRIDKKHIPQLLDYFKDVAGPAHWGLPISDDEFALVLAFRELHDGTRAVLLQKTRHLAAKTVAEREADAKLLESTAAPATSARGKRQANAT